MDKNTLLQNITQALRDGIIVPSDLRILMEAQEVHAPRAFSISGILYYIGGGIAFLGIGIFVGQQWSDLSSFLRILLTLGAGLAFFVAAALLESTKKLDRVPDAFHFLAGLLIPGGVFVTLNELGFHGGNFGPGIIFAMFFLLYVLAYRFMSRNLLLTFSVLYATFAFFLLTSALMGNAPTFNETDYIAYRFVALGASYIFLGYAFRESSRRVLSPFLYGFGALAVLGGAFALQGWSPTQSIFWEILSPGLVFGAMFLAIHIRSRVMLFLGAVFLIGDIFKITQEYFRDSLSWPLLLIFAGFLLIGVGYLTFYLNRKYLRGA